MESRSGHGGSYCEGGAAAGAGFWRPSRKSTIVLTSMVETLLPGTSRMRFFESMLGHLHLHVGVAPQLAQRLGLLAHALGLGLGHRDDGLGLVGLGLVVGVGLVAQAAGLAERVLELLVPLRRAWPPARSSSATSMFFCCSTSVCTSASACFWALIAAWYSASKRCCCTWSMSTRIP